MRPDSPGMWRTRIAIKAEVPRQKAHLDVKYYFYNSANRSAVLTKCVSQAKNGRAKVKGPTTPANVKLLGFFDKHLVHFIST